MIKIFKKILLLEFIILLFVCISPSIVLNAVEIYKYELYFDYEILRKRNLVSSVIDSGRNISKARIENADGAISDFTVDLYCNKNYNTETIKQNTYLSLEDFDIVVNTSYYNITITLEDENHNPIYETNEDYLYVHDLIDQKYYITIICTDHSVEVGSKAFITNELTVSLSLYIDINLPTGKIYDENNNIISGNKTNSNYITFNGNDSYSGIKEMHYIYENNNILYDRGTKLYNEGTYQFYCIDNAGNISEYYTVTLDKSPPTLLIENAVINSDVNTSFTVSVEDNHIAYLYYKTPVMSIYSITVNNNITINETMAKGKYYFYAIDNYGNKTKEFWINYGGEDPTIKINKIENSNSVYITWKKEELNVLLNNVIYNKEDIIYNEGNYELTIIDQDNNISKLYFKVDCYYIRNKIVEATCMYEGYTIYNCISCNNVKYGDYTLKGSHSYNHYEKPPTCLNSGGVYYYCVHCNYNYMEEQTPPLGHNLEYSIVDSSCTQKGQRTISCMNCDYYVLEEIDIKNHKYILLNTYNGKNITINTYMCEHCMEIYEQEEENKIGLIINFISFIENKYLPYVVWILLASVSVWSIIVGARIIFMKNSEEQVITKNIIKNYIFGLIAIFILIMCVPLLIQAISII